MVVKPTYMLMILCGHPRFPELRHSLASGNPGRQYQSGLHVISRRKLTRREQLDNDNSSIDFDWQELMTGDDENVAI